jgi:creatinine amidohydrolase/Fe(II)-dependent formamide hydrolase-like protein
MRLTILAIAAALISASTASAQASKSDNNEFAMMTWPEVKAAIAAGKTTALVYTGGTEQRGPQNVNGGHTLMGTEIVKAIAARLSNALWLPVLPYSPNDASAELPGTIGLTPEILRMVLERVSEQAIATGFTIVVIMGDHGGGQPQIYADVAMKLDAKYGPQGKHVFFCDEVYAKAKNDFNDWLVAHGYPRSSHAGIPDTSTMLYLGGGSKRPDPDGRGRSGAAARAAWPRPGLGPERAAAQEQRHHRRRASVYGGAG